MNTSPLPVVRLTRAGSYCSGTLVAPDLQPHAYVAPRLVLTCAHFFREPGPYRVTRAGVSARVSAVRVINGTDLALALLDRPAGPRAVPGLLRDPVRLGQTTRTRGFGGHALDVHDYRGLLVATLPWAVSRDGLTRVRHGALVAHGAVKGDSGGPVLLGDMVAGVQSLVLDPFGTNLGLATVSLVAPHLPSLRRAARALLLMKGAHA
ncbi:trypsin-like peptidase domain-containing protein [Corynebacterium phoceense]|uniref:trypsin-like peptidase domain-containing protein n=1 Tax=Corynebacterium phoceense TaxID=1686286 RepID=UPI0034CFE467